MARTKAKKTGASKTTRAAAKSTATKTTALKEIELDFQTLLVPIAIIIGSLIISIPISLSIYFGLNNANLGGVAGSASAAECDTADPLSDDCYVKYADEVGIDVDKFQQCLEGQPYDDKVASEMSYGEEVGVSGTPSIFIGERVADDKMRGFVLGAGQTRQDLSDLVKTVKDKGIDEAAKNWKEAQLADLGSYETQLRDYYSQQGQTGDALEATVKAGLDQRKTQIENDLKVQEYTYGEGLLRGDKSSKAVIMEFSDYECPYCQRFAQSDGGVYVKEAADSGEILFVYRDFPLESLHPRARSAANAARCAGEQDKYFEYHDVLFGVSE